MPPPPTAVILALTLAVAGCSPSPRTDGHITHGAYVWQRHWTTNVVVAVREHQPRFASLIVLAAEVAWVSGHPKTTRVDPDWSTLRSPDSGGRVGLALRIGAFSGPFRKEDASTRFLRQLASALVTEATAKQVDVAELQIDFDCAERRLAGYQVWVEALREAVAPIPLTITTLPSWLDKRAFRNLVKSTDGFVLQVHSLARPRSPDEAVALCDPLAAHHAVERAAEVCGRIPFRVALPTYGYRLAFGTNGQFLGASAEGTLAPHPPGTIHRELTADPVAMSRLVADWTADRPAAMQGILWYRLPVKGDRFNWRWRTLESVLQGTPPVPQVQATSRQPAPHLLEIDLINEGAADFLGGVAVRATWREHDARRVGADGVLGFEARFEGPTHILFTNSICRLPAGDRSRIGWLRLDASTPIHLETLVCPSTQAHSTGKHAHGDE